jgi:phytoene dehydrogenase-like protein
VTTRILVVGGGIAGLATARALAHAGFSVEVVERERT